MIKEFMKQPLGLVGFLTGKIVGELKNWDVDVEYEIDPTTHKSTIIVKPRRNPHGKD